MSTRTSQYRYWLSKDGKWRFCLVGGNGEPQGPSQGYGTKAGVLRGIGAHRRAARLAVIVEVDQAPSA